MSTLPFHKGKLIYEKTGKEVNLGDEVTFANGDKVFVDYFAFPHKPSSEGKVSVSDASGRTTGCREVYVSVIGAKWVNRTDR